MPWGKLGWLQLPFVCQSSSDVFQETLYVVIKVVPGITGIRNDVLAKGYSKINGDITVLSLLETAQNNNLKFNLDKIQFRTRECKFLGSFSPQMDALQCKMDLKCFQGMVNYLRHYSSQLTQLE